MKIRLDAYLYQAGVFQSRSEARAAIMEGLVSVDRDSRVKPGTQVTGKESIVVESPAFAYVSRGGVKLEGALDGFGVEVKGKTVMDVGASTGGFTDCLLTRGAYRVIALDVGKGQLHWKLRNDPRVTVIEGVNVRYLKPGEIPETPVMATVDVSFISLRKVILPIADTLAKDWDIIALVKPQFEAGREKVGKGGVVRDPQTHVEVLSGFIDWLYSNNLSPEALRESQIKGPKGNIEYFIHIKEGKGNKVSKADVKIIVQKAYSELK